MEHQNDTPKPIHGTPQPKNVPHDMVDTPPVPCDLKPGDAVVFTNDYGVSFDMRVRGFSREVQSIYRLPHVPKRFIYLAMRDGKTDGTAWWFAHNAESLRKVTD